MRVVVGGEAGVLDQVLAADRVAQALPQPLVVAAHGDVAVAGAQRLVGRGQPVRGAERPGHAPGRPQLGGLPDRQRERALEQRRVDALPAARPLARGEAERIADGAEQAGGEVADRDAALDGVAARLAGDAHHAGEALGDQVVAGPHGVRAGLPEARDARVDQARVERARASRSRRPAARRRRAGSSPPPRRRRAARRWKTARCASSLRSSVTQRLLRLTARNAAVSSPAHAESHRAPRRGRRCPGGSTLTTSAPMSAEHLAAERTRPSPG